MNVLVAIDGTPASARILRAGRVMAGLLHADLTAMHVSEGSRGADDAATVVATSLGVHCRHCDGDPMTEIVQAIDDPDVVLAVMGARARGAGPRPGGHVALSVAERVAKPLLVVPPGARLPDPDQQFRRVLLPLEGTTASTASVAPIVSMLADAGVELVAVHVFERTAVPRFWDHPGHAEQSWAVEFLNRWCAEPRVDLHLRRGAAPTAVLEVSEREGVDLVTLGWSQHLAPHRALVVNEALSRSRVPILLIPQTADTAATTGAPRGVR